MRRWSATSIRYVGEVIAYLKQIGQFDNTFIMFTSDNGAEARPPRPRGAPINDHVGKEYDHSLDNLGSATTYVMYGANWASASATPFNRHKGSGWEGGIHVPAFVHFPRKVKARQPQRCHRHGDGPAADLPRGGRQRSIPALHTREGRYCQCKAHPLFPCSAARQPGFMLPIPYLAGNCSVPGPSGRENWKLVWDQSVPAASRHWVLFDIRKDPFEQRDLSSSEPEAFARLQGQWDAYAAQNGVIY